MSGFLTSYLDHLSYKDPCLLLLPDLQSGTDASSPVGCEAFISTSLPYQTVEDTYTGTFMQSVCETHLIETGKHKKTDLTSSTTLIIPFYLSFSLAFLRPADTLLLMYHITQCGAVWGTTCMSQTRMCSRGAHCSRQCCMHYSSTSPQWSGWRGREGGKEPKTSGAQLHWLSYQKHLSAPLCSSGRYFMDTS